MPVKPGETIGIKIRSICLVEKVSVVVKTPAGLVTATPYVGTAYVRNNTHNLRIVKDAKYSATGGFGVEKI